MGMPLERGSLQPSRRVVDLLTFADQELMYEKYR